LSEAVTSQTSAGGFVGPPMIAIAATIQRTVAITRPEVASDDIIKLSISTSEIRIVAQSG
jgi:hypothetical protein